MIVRGFAALGAAVVAAVTAVVGLVAFRRFAGPHGRCRRCEPVATPLVRRRTPSRFEWVCPVHGVVEVGPTRPGR